MSALSDAAGMMVREAAGGATFAVYVQPGAKREGVVGIDGEALKIALTEPAMDGRENDALVRFVAELLSVPRMSVEMVAGRASRLKVLRVIGVTADEVRRTIAASVSAEA